METVEFRSSASEQEEPEKKNVEVIHYHQDSGSGAGTVGGVNVLIDAVAAVGSKIEPGKNKGSAGKQKNMMWTCL